MEMWIRLFFLLPVCVDIDFTAKGEKIFKGFFFDILLNGQFNGFGFGLRLCVGQKLLHKIISYVNRSPHDILLRAYILSIKYIIAITCQDILVLACW